ncbi:MAG: response regulator [Desulfosoma sp.]
MAEDDKGVRDYLVSVLREAGYRVLEARDGVEAVEVFVDHLETISLVVCDGVMPTMGGQEAVAMIRHGGRRVPAIFISGYTGRSSALQTETLRDTLFLEKPVKRRVLLQAVRSLLDGRDGVNPSMSP